MHNRRSDGFVAMPMTFPSRTRDSTTIRQAAVPGGLNLYGSALVHHPRSVRDFAPGFGVFFPCRFETASLACAASGRPNCAPARPTGARTPRAKRCAAGISGRDRVLRCADCAGTGGRRAGTDRRPPACGDHPGDRGPGPVLDVDEAEARKILTTLDPLAALAGADAGKLDELLKEFADRQRGRPEDDRRAGGEAGCAYAQLQEIVEDEIPEPPDEAITQARRPVVLGEPPPALRRQREAGGRRPAARRRRDPPREHRPAVQREGRAAIEQRHRRRAVSSFQGTTHHQGLDLARHPGKAKPTSKKLRAKDRPLANDFVSDEEFDRLLDAWFGNMARVLEPGRGVLHLGRLRQLRELPAVPEEARPVLLAGDHLGQAAPGADAQGLHGQRTSGASTAGRKARRTSSSARTTPPTCGT